MVTNVAMMTERDWVRRCAGRLRSRVDDDDVSLLEMVELAAVLREMDRYRASEPERAADDWFEQSVREDD